MTSRRFMAAGVMIAAVAAGSVACTPEPSTPDELDAWMSSWEDENDDDAEYLALATGESETEVAVSFPEPRSLRTVEFSCFGDGAMKFSVTLRQGSSYGGGVGTAESVDCASSPHQLVAPDLGFAAGTVEGIVFKGFDASVEWRRR